MIRIKGKLAYRDVSFLASVIGAALTHTIFRVYSGLEGLALEAAYAPAALLVILAASVMNGFLYQGGRYRLLLALVVALFGSAILLIYLGLIIHFTGGR